MNTLNHVSTELKLVICRAYVPADSKTKPCRLLMGISSFLLICAYCVVVTDVMIIASIDIAFVFYLWFLFSPSIGSKYRCPDWQPVMHANQSSFGLLAVLARITSTGGQEETPIPNFLVCVSLALQTGIIRLVELAERPAVMSYYRTVPPLLGGTPHVNYQESYIHSPRRGQALAWRHNYLVNTDSRRA